MRPVSRAVHNLELRKGAISATAVFIVISVVISGLAMDISVNTIVDSFKSANEKSTTDWFSNNIAANARQLCESGDENMVTPIDSAYSRNIGGLDSIEFLVIEAGTYPSGPHNDGTVTFYHQLFRLGFRSGEEKDIYVTKSYRQSGYSEEQVPCQDVEFNGSGSGQSITGMENGEYDYRLFSEGKGDLKVEITPGDEQ